MSVADGFFFIPNDDDDSVAALGISLALDAPCKNDNRFVGANIVDV